MVHPGAIYLHEAQSFFVKDLNLEEHVAYLKPIESEYYTEPLRGTEVTVLSTTAQAAIPGGGKAWGELAGNNSGHRLPQAALVHA